MKDAPSPRTIDRICLHIHDEIDALYNIETGRCEPYAWTHSGISRLRGSRHVNDDGSAFSVVPDSAFGAELANAKGAADDLRVALEALRRCRARLRFSAEGTPGVGQGWIGQEEHSRLQAAQETRTRNGGGCGAT